MTVNHSYGLFGAIPMGPEDPMNDLKARADGDFSAQKVDLGIGIYRGIDSTRPYVLSAVKQAKRILNENDPGHEYEITTGNLQFTTRAAALMFGAQSPALLDRRIATTQTASGTSANHIGAVFAQKFLPPPHLVYVGTPAWGNYKPLFEHAGYRVEPYKYYDAKTKSVDFKSVTSAAQMSPKGALFVLQGCCHNPTGADMTHEEWAQLAAIMKSRNLIPFFDIAYQGLGQGMDDDAWSVRHFVEQGFEMIVCQSFSKHMSLYGERVGALHVVTSSESEAICCLDQLRCLVRWEFSSSPGYGSRLATIIMSSEALSREWQQEVGEMRTRLQSNRLHLYTLLTQYHKTRGSWDHLIREKGLFHFSGLTPCQVDLLASRYHIYLPSTGRINIAGLNPTSLPLVAAAITNVIGG